MRERGKDMQGCIQKFCHGEGGGWVWNKGGGSSTIVSCESEGSGAMPHPTLARVSV